MELLIEKIFAFTFLLVGLSHVFHPAPWVEFFVWLRSKTYGGFIVVMYTLPIAVVIIAFHNNWNIRPAIFITIAGWIMLVKCVIYGLYPSIFNRVAKKGASTGGIFKAGIVITIASVAILADIYLL